MDSALPLEEEDERDCYSSSSPTLPDDILYEILTHVTLDDLLRRCRRVCRDWNTLTYEPTFKHSHRLRTQSVSGYLIQNLRNHRYHTSFLSIEASSSSISLDFMPVMGVKIEAVSCQAQGLVCCRSDEYLHTRYYICKPVTRQWTRIPNPKTRYQTEKMAIVVKNSHPLHYKIFRFSWSKKHIGLYGEIFDSKVWEWRLCLKPDFLLKHDLFLEPDQVLFHGSLHWLSVGNHIFAFDIDKEIWRLISLPQAKLFEQGKELECMNDDFRIHKQLVNCEGHIGLIYTTWSWIELWVMENYLEEKWKKRYSLSLAPLNRIVGLGYSLLAMETMDSMLVRSYDKLIWYNCTSGVPTQVMKIENAVPPLDSYFHPLDSDCEPCNLGSRECPKGKYRTSLSRT